MIMLNSEYNRAEKIRKQSAIVMDGWHGEGDPGARRHEHDGVSPLPGPDQR